MKPDASSLAPLPTADWPPSLSGIIDDMQGTPLNVHALMAHNPALLNAWWPLRQYLVNGGRLSRRHAELVILRVASRLGCWYEWASHVVRGLANGLSAEEVARAREEPGNAGWCASESLLLQAVDELHEVRKIRPATRKALGDHYSVEQILDLITLHGIYQTLGALIETFDLPLDSPIDAQLPDSQREEEFRAT